MYFVMYSIKWLLSFIGKTLYQLGICIVTTMLGASIALHMTITMLEQSWQEHGWWMLLWLPWTAFVSGVRGAFIMGVAWTIALLLVWLTNRSFRKRMDREAEISFSTPIQHPQDAVDRWQARGIDPALRRELAGLVRQLASAGLVELTRRQQRQLDRGH